MFLVKEFNNAFQGQPWHGKSSLEIIEASDPSKVFNHWIPNAHSIAELVLHLTGWTEEAINRLQGKEAREPIRGDWPVVSGKDLATWQQMRADFKVAHQNLLVLIQDFHADQWEKMIVASGEIPDVTVCSYSELVNGIVQHLAYHSGQISLLQKF
ncbi:MAG TPA: DinB family protein [Daejeonella sp.]|nr:DinB family protein [Daejeonella sp.]